MLNYFLFKVELYVLTYWYIKIIEYVPCVLHRAGGVGQGGGVRYMYMTFDSGGLYTTVNHIVFLMVYNCNIL